MKNYNSNPPWYGVDLDGTLAHYDSYSASDHIGPPIKPMADRVKAWLAEGQRVKIFTARAHPGHPEAPIAIAAIKKWTEEHFGKELEVTCEKDLRMLELWDDRAVQVVPNEGVPVCANTIGEPLVWRGMLMQQFHDAKFKYEAFYETRSDEYGTIILGPTKQVLESEEYRKASKRYQALKELISQEKIDIR